MSGNEFGQDYDGGGNEYGRDYIVFGGDHGPDNATHSDKGESDGEGGGFNYQAKLKSSHKFIIMMATLNFAIKASCWGDHRYCFVEWSCENGMKKE